MEVTKFGLNPLLIKEGVRTDVCMMVDDVELQSLNPLLIKEGVRTKKMQTQHGKH